MSAHCSDLAGMGNWDSAVKLLGILQELRAYVQEQQTHTTNADSPSFWIQEAAMFLCLGQSLKVLGCQ